MHSSINFSSYSGHGYFCVFVDRSALLTVFLELVHGNKTSSKLMFSIFIGQAYCSVEKSGRNPLNIKGPRCYFAPSSEKNNDYYHLLGVFNTNGRLVSSATLANINGHFNGMQPYFAFNGLAARDSRVTFKFEDGSSESFKLSDCDKGNKAHVWS